MQASVGRGANAFSGYPGTALSVAMGGAFSDVRLVIFPHETFTVASGGTMNLTAPVGSQIDWEGWLVNSGTINFTNGSYVMSGLATYPYFVGGIVNQPGGKINFTGSVTFGITDAYGMIDQTYLTNQGSMTWITGVSNSSSMAFAALDNTQGAITNLSGTLSLGTLVTNFAGIFYTAPGAVTQLAASWDITTPG